MGAWPGLLAGCQAAIWYFALVIVLVGRALSIGLLWVSGLLVLSTGMHSMNGTTDPRGQMDHLSHTSTGTYSLHSREEATTKAWLDSPTPSGSFHLCDSCYRVQGSVGADPGFAIPDRSALQAPSSFSSCPGNVPLYNGLVPTFVLVLCRCPFWVAATLPIPMCSQSVGLT
jgi:hypothetical protein